MHSSTGKTPFEIVEGRPKVPPILRMKRQHILPLMNMSRILKRLFKRLEKLSLHLSKGKNVLPTSIDAPMEFKEDEWVLLKFSKARV